MHKTTYEDYYKVLWDSNQRNRKWEKGSQFKTPVEPNIKEQVRKNQELTIQQLRRKKARKYRKLKYGEQITEKQSRNSSIKFSQPNQEGKNNNSNQCNTKRTYTEALRTAKEQNQIEQQNQRETKTQQHDEILNNHNHHARNTTYTRSNINTINSQEEQPKDLKQASIQRNMDGN